jgi:hypothetical protein
MTSTSLNSLYCKVPLNYDNDNDHDNNTASSHDDEEEAGVVTTSPLAIGGIDVVNSALVLNSTSGTVVTATASSSSFSTTPSSPLMEFFAHIIVAHNDSCDELFKAACLANINISHCCYEGRRPAPPTMMSLKDWRKE